MVKIEKLTNENLEQTLQISVSDEQLKFVGTIAEIMDNVTETDHTYVLLDDSQVVGFFIIDTIYAQKYDFCNLNNLGLRGFLIDHRCQGKGLGKSAVLAIKPFLSANYSDYQNISLTVNCKNAAAYKCYLNGGFTDSGELYKGGPAGPQHIMSMKIE